MTLNVENNPRRKKLLSKRHFQRNKYNCLNEKMPQIQTQNDKNTLEFRILKILCNFCLFYEKLGDLECQRR